MSDSGRKVWAPTWDGTGDKSGQYLAKTKAMAVLYWYGGTCSLTKMAGILTESTYNAYAATPTDPAVIEKKNLYEIN